MQLPTEADVRAAHERVAGHVHRTPAVTSRTLNERAGAEVFLKCENFQRVGAFKFRGATNAVLSLSPAELSRGVATHSSGNHAQALALAARNAGAAAHIVMPSNAPLVKRRAVEGYGARVIECEPTLASRQATLAQVVDETGAVFIHPFDDNRIIAGQGTAAIELFEQVANIDALVIPVGGGGLICGSCLVAGARKDPVQVYGVEPEVADDALRSLAAGHIIESDDPVTIADGLRTSLSPRTFAIIQAGVRKIVTVSEEQIFEATAFLLQRMKIVVEPSGAVVVAAVAAGHIEGRRIGAILSGGNLDLERFWA